jgi:hypothetical protein
MFRPLDDAERVSAAVAVREEPGGRVIMPVPADMRPTKTTFARFAPRGTTFTEAYVYRNEAGEALFYVVRYDGPDGKTIRPFCLIEGAGGVEWTSKAAPCLRVVFNLDKLVAEPGAPVLVVEGERTANAAAKILPNYVVITSSGGANAAAKSDWPLRDRRIDVWPDNDDAGRAYAEDVVRLATAAGAASVRVVKLPDGLPEGWDLADAVPSDVDLDFERVLREAYSSNDATEDSTVASIDVVSATKTAASWDAPDLSVLGNGRRPAPQFDVGLLGDRWGVWALERSAAASAPVDYVACALLASAAAAIGNSRWPKAGSEWMEPPVLNVALVGNPSSGKSPGIDAAFSLIRAAEAKMGAGHDEDRRVYETKKRLAEAAKEAWEASVFAANKDGQKAAPMPAAAEAPTPPVRPRILVMDTSTERLGALAAGLPRGLLRAYDELAGWFASFGRYGGGGTDRSFAISAYGGRPYLIDRQKNPTSDAITIPRLSVGVLGGIQPDRLVEAIDGPDDGLPARFLWSWPDPLPGFNLARGRAPDDVAKDWFQRLVDIQMGIDIDGNPVPIALPLEGQAEDLLEDFGRHMKARDDVATGIYAGAVGKARGHVLRLSAVLELLRWSASGEHRPPDVISLDAMRCAATLVDDYFLPMAERVFGDAAIPVAERRATMLARHLRQAQQSTFNKRAVRRAVGGALRDAAAMDGACASLVEAGVIAPRLSRAGGSSGRMAENYEVHPALLRA